MSKEQYLKNPNVCPVCQSQEITGGETNVDSDSAWQEVSCNLCHATWNDVYKLIGYSELIDRSQEI